MSDSIQSRDRVKEFGEVYTPIHIVNDMLDLVADEANRIDSKFLEPACGNGNFVVEIFRRKLAEVSKASGCDAQAYNLNLLKAVASVYGVDIIPGNILETHERVMELVKSEYTSSFGTQIPKELLSSINYVMGKNIQLGDSLRNVSLKTTSRNRRARAAQTAVASTVDNGDLLVSEWLFNGEQVEEVIYRMELIDMEVMRCIPIHYLSLRHFEAPKTSGYDLL